MSGVSNDERLVAAVEKIAAALEVLAKHFAPVEVKLDPNWQDKVEPVMVTRANEYNSAFVYNCTACGYNTVIDQGKRIQCGRCGSLGNGLAEHVGNVPGLKPYSVEVATTHYDYCRNCYVTANQYNSLNNDGCCSFCGTKHDINPT